MSLGAASTQGDLPRRLAPARHAPFRESEPLQDPHIPATQAAQHGPSSFLPLPPHRHPKPTPAAPASRGTPRSRRRGGARARARAVRVDVGCGVGHERGLAALAAGRGGRHESWEVWERGREEDIAADEHWDQASAGTRDGGRRARRRTSRSSGAWGTGSGCGRDPSTDEVLSASVSHGCRVEDERHARPRIESLARTL